MKHTMVKIHLAWLVCSMMLAISAMQHTQVSSNLFLPLYAQAYLTPRIHATPTSVKRQVPPVRLSHAVTLTAYQIGQYAYQAGFRGDGLAMAVAIAMAESSGITNEVGPVGEIGLWQVYIPSHPQYSRAFLLNPLNNAQAAYAISHGGSNWRPWCTAYSDGLCGSRGGTFEGTGSPYQKYL